MTRHGERRWGATSRKAYLECLDPEHGDRQAVERIARFEISRDYLLFSLLAGVRCDKGDPPPVSLPKGLPQGSRPPSYEIDDTLSELEVDGYCSQEEADTWVQERVAVYLNEPRTLVSDPDAHSASWLGRAELEEVEHRYSSAAGETHVELAAIVGAVRALDDVGREARLVFWFKG